MNTLFKAEFELCPNVITDDFFIDPKDVKKSNEIFQFVNVAILDERKNQGLILEAFAKNYRGDEKFSLVIAGDGPLLEPLRKLAVELGIERQVGILGYQNRGQIIDLLDASHCFVLASHSETFGVVVIEAMARGIPAISSRIDGTREIFNADNGLLFEPNSLDDLGAKMNEVVENYSNFEPGKIIDSVKSNYGPDAVYCALYPND
jgi:glycosyltransferase involved in cell wall biosynthesis